MLGAAGSEGRDPAGSFGVGGFSHAELPSVPAGQGICEQSSLWQGSAARPVTARLQVCVNDPPLSDILTQPTKGVPATWVQAQSRPRASLERIRQIT